MITVVVVLCEKVEVTLLKGIIRIITTIIGCVIGESALSLPLDLPVTLRPLLLRFLDPCCSGAHRLVCLCAFACSSLEAVSLCVSLDGPSAVVQTCIARTEHAP